MAPTSVPITPLRSPPRLPPPPPLPPGDFRVGRVLSMAASLLLANFVKFVAVALIAALPNLFAPSYQGAGSGSTIALQALAYLIVYLVLSSFTQAVILHGTFQHLRGRRVDLGEAVSKTLSRLPAIIGIALLWILAILAAAVAYILVAVLFALVGGPIVTGIFTGLTTIALLVGACVLFATWYVGVPVCLSENLGPARSLGRSRELTAGFRWKIFGMIVLLVLMGVAAMTATLLLTIVLIPFLGALVTSVLTVAWSGVLVAFASVVTAVSYHALRVAKEGVDIEQIAAVFD